MINTSSTFVRIAMGVSYHGADYHGWQRQNNLLTVQAVLEQAIAKVANHAVSVVAAGRTDVGVHATEQVIHFDFHGLAESRSERTWVLGVNANLPKTIRVRWAKGVTPDFHARFSATARQYRYYIYQASVPSALFPTQLTWEFRELDREKMQTAANYLLGEHDFSAFRASACQSKSTRRFVHSIEISRRNRIIVIDIKANAFLHHMVRNIVGVLLCIGRGDAKPEWAKSVLASRQRTQAGVTAPPHGLYLVKIDYPEHFTLPKMPIEGIL